MNYKLLDWIVAVICGFVTLLLVEHPSLLVFLMSMGFYFMWMWVFEKLLGVKNVK